MLGNLDVMILVASIPSRTGMLMSIRHDIWSMFFHHCNCCRTILCLSYYGQAGSSLSKERKDIRTVALSSTMATCMQGSMGHHGSGSRNEYVIHSIAEQTSQCNEVNRACWNRPDSLSTPLTLKAWERIMVTDSEKHPRRCP